MSMQGVLRAKELQKQFPDIDWGGILDECGEGALLACGNYYEHESVQYSSSFAYADRDDYMM